MFVSIVGDVGAIECTVGTKKHFPSETNVHPDLHPAAHQANTWRGAKTRHLNFSVFPMLHLTTTQMSTSLSWTDGKTKSPDL